MQSIHDRRWVRRLFVVVISAFAVIFILQKVQAGSLAPSSSPAGTFYSLGTIFNPLASTSYDSSAITADSGGSALQITKCIITKLNGGNC